MKLLLLRSFSSCFAKLEIPSFAGSAFAMLTCSFIEFCILSTNNFPRTLLIYLANMPYSFTNYFLTILCNSKFNSTGSRGKTSGKGNETIFDETKSESTKEQFEAEVPEEVDCEGLNDNVGKEEDGNEIGYFDSDDHRSILGLEDDNNFDVCRRRSRFPTYNPNSASPHFYIGMLFKDGEQFKSVIHKYLMCFRSELKIIRNEPNRVRVKCIASLKCKGGIFASYSNMPDACRNKMVNLKVITEHFEAIIGGHPKMKLRDIQRMVTSKMYVNVNMRRCRRAKKRVKDLVGNFDYVDELRLKNPGSTINMEVNRVTPESLPHFKRFYVCFEALKRGWKEGCRPILGLDGCLSPCLLCYYLGSLVPMLSVLYGILNKILMTTYIAHEFVLQPINGSHERTKSGIKPVLPPVEKTMPSRPKKNRRKAKNEPKKMKPIQLSRVGLIMRYRKCGGEGHNKRSCIQPNTTGTHGSDFCSQFGKSMRTRNQKKTAYQGPISIQESTAAKKMKK
ncbi:hypothetical protein CXB51_028444 [Gossypium anomalum]|uniref:Transposase MuDR plant domain-containing protein n=1 Tax=Gossypium anomalum TaxID=47600 RepID=A0A8J5YYM7_9ROSI|nr:hypothetical protein CXB51_028444 [Gossypium anomalum]